jgi:hypothetical protein
MDYTVEPKPKRIGRFLGLNPNVIGTRHPLWLYHDELEPRIAENEEEEKSLRDKGYDLFNAGMLANKTIVNWFWDLEDFSPKQLAVFAKDEYGVDLPIDASQDVLYRSICKLAKFAPQNENRLVFIAQMMEMNLEATMAEIKRMAGGGIDIEFETETFEVEL